MRVSQFFAALTICAVSVSIAHADANYFSLAGADFSQNWTNTSLITANDVWSGVPSIEGYRGDDLTTATGTDPQTILTPGFTTPLNVLANLTSTTNTSGGLQEIEITNPTIAMQGSATADAPFLVMYLNATGRENINVSYLLRDLDGTADNAIQQFALQYRTDTASNFINVAAGYVADATTQATATQLTPVSVTLPAGANNAANLQVRIVTTNAVGNDELVGVDDLVVSSVATVVIPEANTFGLFILALPIIGGVIARRRK